jgi:RimJ/RimL family protein N-acetyltransferase
MADSSALQLTTDTTQLPAGLRQRIDDYWARFLNCPPETLRQPGIHVFTSKQVSGLFAVKTDGGWTAAITPGIDPAAVTRLETLPLNQPESAAAAHEMLKAYGLTQAYGPAQITYCTVDSISARQPISYRPLIPDDRAEAARFRAELGRDDWDFDDSQAWPASFGIFDGGRLVGASQVRVWDDLIAEVFTDTLSDYRQRGYAVALTHAATQWILDETHWIPQTDAQLDLVPSIRIINRIGYQLYGWFIMAELADSYAV